MRFGFDFNGLYGQDAYAYLLHAREWKVFFLGGNTPGSFFWPPNYSIVSGFLGIILQSEIYALQLVSVGSLIGTAWIVDKWISRAYHIENHTRIAFVTLAILLSPYLFRLGQQSMSDMLAMFFLTASFYHLWNYLKTDSIKSLILWSLFSAFAITTRYPAVIILLPALVYVGFRLMSKRQFGKFVVGLLPGLIPLSFAILWKLKTGGINNDIQNVILEGLRFSNFLKTEFHNADGSSSYMLPNLLFNLSVAIHPGTFFLGLALLPFSFTGLKRDRFRLILLTSILVYALFLSGIPFQNSRVMTFSFPLVVMFLYPAFLRLTSLFESKKAPLKVVFSLCVFVQIALCARAMQPSVSYNYFERELVSWVETTCAAKVIYTSSYSQLFDVYNTGNPLMEIFNTRYSSFEDNSVFIFNEALIEGKIKQTVPHQNWEQANKLMSVEKEKCWSNGWCIYALQLK